MKKFIVFFLLFIIVLTTYPQSNEQVIINNEQIANNEEKVKMVSLNYNNEIINEELEEYIIGVVACEMPANFKEEALKAMSVAARSFALYKLSKNENYVFKTTVSDQCYISQEKMKSKWKTNYDKYYNKIKEAVYSTKNEYMTYKDKVIIAFYFSISNGYTENSENVFPQKLDYLVSVDSKWDSKYNYKQSEKTYTIKEFLNKLGINSTTINNIEITRSKTNRIKTIKINNKTFKGTKFRSLLSLKSTDVEIKYDKKQVYLTTKGNGHGVGMSQYGANEMAKEGYTYDEILKYYYKGINIVNNL